MNMKPKVKTSEIELIDGTIAIIKDTKKYKALKSENYNFFFNKSDGFFCRWGKGDYSTKKKTITKQELELFSLWSIIWKEKFNLNEFVNDLDTDGSLDVTSVEILDWEISEKCDFGCAFCYKSNVSKGKNTSFESFKETFHKLSPSIITIAYGIGSIHLCPDLWKILDYTRANGIIPTITINGDATEEDLEKLSKVVGACAVSVYDKEKSYNCIKSLTDKGLEQVNIHAIITEEHYLSTMNILNDIKTDPRLSKLRALVMLSLKEKGRSVGKYHKLSQEKYDTLMKFAIENDIGFGFDSCSSAKTYNFVNKNPEYNYIKTYIEPCESSIYSSYLNVSSEYFPCSFSEGTDGWETGLTIKDDFMKDIWFNQKTQDFRKKVKNCRNCNIACPIYDI